MYIYVIRVYGKSAWNRLEYVNPMWTSSVLLTSGFDGESKGKNWKFYAHWIHNHSHSVHKVINVMNGQSSYGVAQACREMQSLFSIDPQQIGRHE